MLRKQKRNKLPTTTTNFFANYFCETNFIVFTVNFNSTGPYPCFIQCTQSFFLTGALVWTSKSQMPLFRICRGFLQGSFLGPVPSIFYECSSSVCTFFQKLLFYDNNLAIWVSVSFYPVVQMPCKKLWLNRNASLSPNVFLSIREKSGSFVFCLVSLFQNWLDTSQTKAS